MDDLGRKLRLPLLQGRQGSGDRRRVAKAAVSLLYTVGWDEGNRVVPGVPLHQVNQAKTLTGPRTNRLGDREGQSLRGCPLKSVWIPLG